MEILAFLGFLAAVVVVAAISLAKRARRAFPTDFAQRGDGGGNRHELD